MCTSPRNLSQLTLARDLGLSQATVSNALNGKRHLCSSDQYARIWSHALAMGYRGRGLKREATPELEIRQVCIVHGAGGEGAPMDPGVGRVQWTLENRLAARGIATVPLGSSGHFRETLFGKLTRSGGLKPSLAILGGVHAPFLAELKSRVNRLVTAGCWHPELAPGVIADDAQAAKLLVAHLKNLGHRRLAWLALSDDRPATAARHLAVVAAAAEGEVTVENRGEPVAEGVGRREAGRRWAATFARSRLRTKSAATAIVCADAVAARGVIDGLTHAGVPVPDAVSVVAWDSAQVPEDENPLLTTVGSEPDRMAAAITDLLLDFPVASAGRFRRVLLPAKLTPGVTSGLAPA